MVKSIASVVAKVNTEEYLSFWTNPTTIVLQRFTDVTNIDRTAARISFEPKVQNIPMKNKLLVLSA
jgi:fumarate reductase subunit C